MLFGSAQRWPAGTEHLQPSAHASRCRRAVWVLESQHTPCTPDVNLAFVRMGSNGVTNDINLLVKGLHYTMMHARLIQRKFHMVVLPPTASEQAQLGLNLSLKRPWHWAHQYELSQVFNLSACHEQLVRDNASWLERVAAEGLTEELKRAQRRLLVSIQVSWNSEPQMPTWLGPDAKRWWWSLLTSHLLHVHGDLERRVLSHPAIEELAQTYGSGHPVSGFLRGSGLLRFEPCSPAPMLFDVGLHVRQGDACGAYAVPQPARRCIKSLGQALDMVSAANLSFDRGASHEALGVKAHVRTFLASDSDAIIWQASNASHTSSRRKSFAVRSFGFNRTKYDGTTFIEFEKANARRGDRSEVLVETLLDLALLGGCGIISESKDFVVEKT